MGYETCINTHVASITKTPSNLTFYAALMIKPQTEQKQKADVSFGNDRNWLYGKIQTFKFLLHHEGLG